MKKWMKLTAAAVVATALLYGCGGSGGGEKKTDDGKKQIAVVQVMQHGSLDAANQGFLDGLKERGYGTDKISVDQQNAQGDQSNLKTIASRFKSNRPDLICAISTPAAQAAANEIHDLPIIGCAITDFETAKLVKSNSRPETNVTGVNDRGPVEKQVDMGLKFLPAAKRLGLIYSSSEVNSQIQADQAKAHAASLGLTVVERTVSSVNDIQQAAESMVGQVDFIYVPTDNVIASSIPTLVKVTDPAKIPVFVGADSMAKDGALGSLSVDFYKSGVQAGHMAADVLDGKIKTQDTAVEDPEVLEVIINKKSAETLGLAIPEEYKNAKMVG
mgnify:FL=1